MTFPKISIALVLGLAVLSGCKKDTAAGSGNSAVTGQKVATSSTLAAGLAKDSRFRAAIHQAGLDRTLAGQGPYTVLVPSDEAFAKLPAGALDGLMKPESRAQLTTLLTFHILPGVILNSDIERAIQNGKGSTKLATMNGATITAMGGSGGITLSDSKGGKARLGPDEQHSNGVIHHLNGVLTPS